MSRRCCTPWGARSTRNCPAASAPTWSRNSSPATGPGWRDRPPQTMSLSPTTSSESREGGGCQLLVVRQVVLERTRRDLGVPLAELVDEQLVCLPSTLVLVRVGVEQPEADPDVPLAGTP